MSLADLLNRLFQAPENEERASRIGSRESVRVYGSASGKSDRVAIEPKLKKRIEQTLGDSVPPGPGTWVCPSCGYRTRVGPARTITYTPPPCCGNCVTCPYAVRVTFTSGGASE